MPDECDAATQGPGDTGAIVFSLVLIVVSALSFVPQWISIIQDKSSRGVSVFAQSFGTVGCFTQAYCAFLLVMRCGLFGGIPSHEPVGPACAAQNFLTWDCQQLLLALYLTGSFVVGQTPILILIVLFFKPEEEASFVKERRFMRVASSFAAIFIVILILVAGGLIIFDQTYDALHTLGVVATPIGAVCMGSTYIPQIITTHRLKRKGALSLITLGAQVPGAGIVAISLIFDGQSWDVYLPTSASCVTGAVLLAQVIYYEVKLRRKRKTTLQSEFTSPLLYHNTQDRSQVAFEVVPP